MCICQGRTNSLCGSTSFALRGFGYSGPLGSQNDQIMKRRVRLGIYPIGLTVLFVLFLILAFLSHRLRLSLDAMILAPGENYQLGFIGDGWM